MTKRQHDAIMRAVIERELRIASRSDSYYALRDLRNAIRRRDHDARRDALYDDA